MGRSQYLEDPGIQLSSGRVIKADHIDKFGYNSQLGTTYETVWDGNNVYTYIETAGTATVTSSDTGDDNGGTVHVFGVDANFDLVDEVLSIGGGAGSVSFFRVFRAILETANTGTTNSGTITVTVDSKSAAIISIGEGQTLMALYTVPNGHKAYITQFDFGSAKDQEHHFKIITRHPQTANAAFQTKLFISCRGGFSEKNFKAPIEFGPCQDIEIRAKAQSTSAASAGFELVLVAD